MTVAAAEVAGYRVHKGRKNENAQTTDEIKVVTKGKRRAHKKSEKGGMNTGLGIGT